MSQDAISRAIACATPVQIERAKALALNGYAAQNGLQAWSGGDDFRLPLFNLVRNDAHPWPIVDDTRNSYKVHINVLGDNPLDMLAILDRLDNLSQGAIPVYVVPVTGERFWTLEAAFKNLAEHHASRVSNAPRTCANCVHSVSHAPKCGLCIGPDFTGSNTRWELLA